MILTEPDGWKLHIAKILTRVVIQIVNRVLGLRSRFIDRSTSRREKYFIMQICSYNQIVCINLNCAYVIAAQTSWERKKLR